MLASAQTVHRHGTGGRIATEDRTVGEAKVEANIQPIPVTILTGFLGAGKTTLLNHLLSASHGRRLGVIVNDFGAVNIDARLVDVVEGEAMSLTNGCVCCSMRGSLVTTVLQMLRRSPPLEALVVEGSGIADPTAVAGAFRTSTLRDATRLDAIITVVDAENARNPRLDRQLIEEQIDTADIVILNKIDLVDDRTQADVLSWIRSMTRSSHIIPTIGAVVPIEILSGASFSGPVPREAGIELDHVHRHAVAFDSWSYSTASPLAYRKLKRALEELPVDVYRAKGTLALADAPNLRFVAQVVGSRVTIEPQRPWLRETRATDLVFIGASGATTSSDLAARLDACQTDAFVLMSHQNFVESRDATRFVLPGT